MYKSYVAVAPNPEEFPEAARPDGRLMRKPYDWSADVAKLTMPVMLVYGDSDMFRPEHVVKFYQLLGGGLQDAGWQREHMSQNRLAILPEPDPLRDVPRAGAGDTALPFLNGETGCELGRAGQRGVFFTSSDVSNKPTASESEDVRVDAGTTTRSTRRAIRELSCCRRVTVRASVIAERGEAPSRCDFGVIPGRSGAVEPAESHHASAYERPERGLREDGDRLRVASTSR